MNPDPENFSNSPDSKSIGDLIDLLLEQQTLSSEQIELEDSDILPEDGEQQEGALKDLAEDLPEKLDFIDSNDDTREIEVEIESEAQPTLAEAVEYRAFLQQTVEPTTSQVDLTEKANTQNEITALNRGAAENIEPTFSDVANTEQINSSEQITALNPEQASTEDLADAVNSLIPLMIELLQFKLNESKEGVIQTVRPVIDQLIEHRIQEDSPKMAAAIAQILPDAITKKMHLDPETIAKAIAPEIALSIREQIRLDQEAIPQVLGPEMGKAIKAQIESERDAMVDALYPVIGSTISKYMVEVVQDINRKVESTLSPEGIKRKFQAKIQGVSEAELIFKESVGYHIRAIFLIDKDSGLVIQEIQLPGEQHLDSDMLAGMLTAIRSFANDCISSGSELDLIDYGDWKIPLEVAGYCYLAVVVSGEPTKQFINKIRQVLGEIVIEHDDAIQNFAGDPAQVPTGVRAKLEQLTEVNKDIPKKSASSPILLWLLIFILSIVFIPWGIVNHRAKVAYRIEQNTVTQLDAAPELSVYRLDPQVKDGKLTVRGRVPSSYLRDRATAITQEIASNHNLQLDNQIVTVDVPVNPTLVTGEIARLTKLFNQQSGVAISTDYQPPALTITGLILDKSTYQTISQAFRQIPGIKQLVFDVVGQLPLVKQRIYFVSGSSELDFADNFSKINATQKLLQQYPLLHLRLTVHSDGIGSSQINQRLGKRRCQNVKNALVARGIEPNRLVTDCESLLLPEDVVSGHASWSKRYVGFEPFIPSNLSP
ncbi:MAG: OmpA family protein [Cyanobacteria bacterium J06638_38]